MDDVVDAGPPLVGVPSVEATAIDRQRLLKRLDDVMVRPLTVVTGPAGTGKTTLLAQWCRQRCAVPVVWVQVDRGDGPAEVLDRGARMVAQQAGVALPVDGSWLAADGSRFDGDMLDRLAEAAAALPESVVVIDGLQPAGPVGLYGDLASALERSGATQMHLVTASRCLPPSQVASLELHGLAARIEASDLRLDAGEAADVIAARSGRRLDEPTAQELVDRLDGWVAPIVAVGMADTGDRDRVSSDELVDAAFDRIDDYVTYEVLDDLDDDTRRFMLQTACIDELTTPLCEAITGRQDAERVLTSMRFTGLPVVSGGSGATSYRYLRPFREVLDLHYQRVDPAARVTALRQAAARYTDEQRWFDAARCLVRLGEWDQVIDLVMAHLEHIFHHDQISELAEIVSEAPEDVKRRHEGLLWSWAWVLRLDGRVSAAHELLSIHESGMSPAGQMVADIVRASTASWVADVTGPLGYAEAATAACDELDEDFFAGQPTSYTPASTDTYRALARARAMLASCYGGLWERGAPHAVPVRPRTATQMPAMQLMELQGWRATYLAFAGAVDQALSEASEAVTVVTESKLRMHRCAADPLYALGEARRLAARHEDLDELFGDALKLARRNSRGNLIATIIGSRAHLLIDLGKPEDALALFDAEDLRISRLPRTIAGHVVAAEARALAATGAYGKAMARLDAVEPTPRTATCRVALCLALDDRVGAHRVVEQWPKEPTVDSSVRGSLAAALVADAAGERKTADRAMSAALTTASGCQLVQPFIDAGERARVLLSRASGGDGPAEDFARRVHRLAVEGNEARLTPREAAVMSHLANGDTVADVGRKLHLSTNTVKSHVRAIYRKLGAGNRVDAVRVWNAGPSTETSPD